MAENERVARMADDEKDIIVNAVRVLSKSVVHGDSLDPFSKQVESSSDYQGTDGVFKRRLTGQLRKVQEGVGGAGTKQVQEADWVNGYNAFDVVEPPYNLEYLAKLYELSAPHYAAVNAKVANIVGLGHKFIETPKTKRALEKVSDNESKVKKMRQTLDEHRDQLFDDLESFNKEDTFSEVLTKVWRDYEVTGNGYIEIGRKKDGTIGYFGHIPSQTIRLRKKRDGYIQMSGFKVQFFAPFGAGTDDDGNRVSLANPVGGGRPNEVFHLKKYSPTSGYYGVPDIVAALPAVVGNEFAQKYNLDYFENKAVPRYAIILKGAKLGVQAETELLSFFETSLKGQNHRSIYIPLPGDTDENKVELKMEAIEAGTQDSSFTNYRAANLADILMAHRVPVTKVSISESASLAIAKDADKTFKEQVCAPEQRVLEKKLNQFVKELTDAFELKLNEMTLTDEDTQSQIDDRDRKSGVKTANEIRVARGYASHPEGDELFDLNGSTKAAENRAEQTANRARDGVRSSARTDSAGAARNPKGEGRASP